MRLRASSLLAIAAAGAAVAAAVACTDLFHSTDDFVNACDVDPSNPACNSICITDTKAARARAENACAWLGACELPVGNNQFGACVFAGVLAYDCNANPDRTVQGSARTFWDCMSNVGGCGDVARCFGAERCGQASAAFSSCAGPEVRLTCPGGDAAAGYENCAAWGQTCEVRGSNLATCSAEPGGVTSACTAGCGDGGVLTECDDAGNALSVACTDYGAQRCASGAAGLSACVGDHGATCPASPSVTCLDGGARASGCPGGVTEIVDCTLLTGASSCHPGGPTPELGVAAACAKAPCASGTDTCLGNTIQSCFRGTTFTYDCGSIGTCKTISTLDGVRAACAAK